MAPWPNWVTESQRSDLDATGAPSFLELARRCGVPAPTIMHRLKAGLCVAVAIDPATRIPPIAKQKRQKRPRVPPPDDGLTARQRGARRREAARIARGNNLEALHPDVAREWVPDMNGGLQAHEVSPHSSKGMLKAAGWRCSACGLEYRAQLTNRTRRTKPSGCPRCGHASRDQRTEERVRARHERGENLEALFPKVAAELLTDDGAPADRVSPGNTRKRRWRCPACGHVYAASPNGRTARGNGCPECWRRRRMEQIGERIAAVVKGGRNLAATHPELCAEWHPDNPTTPSQVTPRSNNKVKWYHWSDGHKHEWTARVAARTDPKGPRGCPVCAGRVVSPDRNFAATAAREHPDLLQEWSPDNPFGPETYSPASNRRVKWRCSTPGCQNEWSTTIAVRVGGSGCAACSMAKRSKVEVRVVFELAQFFEDLDPTANPRVRIGGRIFEVDAVLSKEKQVAFEYDGCRFHEGQEDDDAERLRALEAAGWKVICFREAPLNAMNRYSFGWNGGKAFTRPHRVAQEVMRRARDLCGLALPDAAEAYLSADAPVARAAADQFIASKKVRSWTKRRVGTATGSEVPSKRDG